MKRISDEQLELLIEKFVNRTNKANQLFLKKIGSDIKELKKLNYTQAHQLIQMLKYGQGYKSIVDERSKLSDANIRDIDKVFETYSKLDQEFYKQFYEYRDKPYIPYSENEALKKQTESLALLTKEEMRNFTRSRAIGYRVTDEKGVLKFKGLKETYEDILDEALITVSQGKDTFDNAMRRSLKSLGESGLRYLDYDSGRSVRLDSMVRMHLRGGLRELHNKNQELFGEEFGYDGIEISVHQYPAEDHAEAQGRQFTIEEYEKLQKTGIAEDYTGKNINLHKRTKTGLAEGFRPISEYNCYHYIYPIILDINNPLYTDEQLEKIINKNEKGFEFEGKHYTMYEGTQLQRKIESEVRKQKDIQILARESDNKELMYSSQRKINQLTAKYKELSDVSGLKKKKKKLSVSGYHKIKIKDDSPTKEEIKRSESVVKNPKTNGINTEVFISKEENEKLANVWLKYYEEESTKKGGHLREFEKERYDRLLKLKENGFKDEVIKLDSIENCNKLLDKVNTEIETETGDIQNTDFRLVQEATVSLYENTKKSPAIMRDLEYNKAFLRAEKNTAGVANTRLSTITLNNNYFKDYDEFYKMSKDYTELHDYADGKKHSWWSEVAKGNETKVVITHEFGHRLQGEISSKIRAGTSNTKAYDYFFKKYGVTTSTGHKYIEADTRKIRRDLIYEPIRRLQEKEGLTQEKIIDKYVSMYGRKSYDEMFAEVFANSQLGKSNALGDELINFLIEIGEWEE